MQKLIFSLALFFLSPHLLANDADQLLKKADEIRNPANSFEMQIEVKDEDSTSTFDVYLMGNDKTLIVTKKPIKDRGRNMLMLDRTFNAYIPRLKRSVRLSLSQKLMGQVANGDISRMRWYGDYKAKIEKKSNDEVQIFMEQNKPDLTYAKIRLWISAKDFKPLRAEYLNISGNKILKQASFSEYKNLAGRMRPSRITIQDERKKTSVINVLSMNQRDLDKNWFTLRKMESFK